MADQFTSVTFWVGAVALALGVVLFIWCMALQRLLARLRQQNQALQEELASLRLSVVGMGKRILVSESANHKSVSEDKPAVDLRPYSEATHLLEMGLSKDEVASRCGLSRAEASLLDALRKKPTA